MKRIVTLALVTAAFGAGVANAQYDPYWDVNRGNRNDATTVEQSQQRQTNKAPSRFQPAPLEQQTNYNPA
jgi:hypothetical protein